MRERRACASCAARRASRCATSRRSASSYRRRRTASTISTWSRWTRRSRSRGFAARSQCSSFVSPVKIPRSRRLPVFSISRRWKPRASGPTPTTLPPASARRAAFTPAASSARSASVRRAGSSRSASTSSATRMSNTSSTSSTVIGAMNVPVRGTTTSRRSAASCWNASRTGTRLTPSRRPTPGSDSGFVVSSRPDTIASRSQAATRTPAGRGSGRDAARARRFARRALVYKVVAGNLHRSPRRCQGAWCVLPHDRHRPGSTDG